MALIHCQRGHYYDDERHVTCPYCSRVQHDDKTMAASQVAASESKTVGIYPSGRKQEPVVGWLVCVRGPERGRDYRLHAGRNFIGRSTAMDICIVDDPRISRENHASIVFDPKSLAFILMPGQSVQTIHEGQAVIEPVVLNDRATFVLGDSALCLVAFCQEDCTWDV